jgi:hypothetical protein
VTAKTLSAADRNTMSHFASIEERGLGEVKSLPLNRPARWGGGVWIF